VATGGRTKKEDTKIMANCSTTSFPFNSEVYTGYR
jgi:hypothetical protein